MKYTIVYRFPAAIIALLLFFSCGSKRNVPDVSKVKLSFSIQRFDRDLFSLDTNHLPEELTRLQQKYPSFLNDYLFNILALPPQQDSIATQLRLFLRDYRPVYDSVQQRFTALQPLEEEITHSLKLARYYFPSAHLPEKLICFVGPIEGFGNVITEAGFAVGLQLYLGKDFSAYQMDYITQIYPRYQSRRFEPAYIPVNCMRNLVEDMYPYKSGGRPLIEQMIELGKRLYLLDLVLPDAPEHLKLGYTAAQLEGCYKNEAVIWNFFLQNELLYAADPALIRDYINDGPKTAVLGDDSPGFIGQFTGWQIIKKWQEKHKDLTPQQLMQTPAKQILEEAKYKPR